MITPLGSKILIQPVKEGEKKTEGGIILSATKDPLDKGKVVRTSEDIQSKLKAGDTVLYEPNSGTPLEEGGTNYILLDEKNVVAKL